MKNASVQKLIRALDRDLTEYQSIPFWSWNNELDEKELVKQIEDMKSVGIGGFIMHARTGLKTEYLGEKWFSCIDACLKKAKELNMKAWVYDENGWPSGFVGGRLLENEAWRAQFLEYEVRAQFDPDAFCVYKESDGGYERVFANEADLTSYHCVYLRTSPANTDILNPEVVDEFIRQTHEEYYKRFADRFGKELAGFFTDEPQYYRWATPYTRAAADPYKKLYGEDICNGLIYLFLQDPRGYSFRQRYFKLLNELYVKNFYKKLYDWCCEHGCQLTGHSIEESSLAGQMIGGAGVMTSYEFEHVPAIDCLGRECLRELSPKQVGSVASQLGLHHVLTETFACCGFDVTPWELKSVAEAQYFNGVNMMCQHLYPYSMAAQGKVDHPPVFSKHGNWWQGFRSFNEYFTRLGFLIANTQEVYDLLIVHPLRNVYLDFVRETGAKSVEATETAFRELLMKLRKMGICYHLADESILERHGKIEADGSLRIGNCRYGTVLLPQMRSIAASTLELLQAFGGKLCIEGLPEMVDGVPSEVRLLANTTMEEIHASAYVSFSCEDGKSGVTARRGELGDYLFLKNYSRTESSRIVMKDVAEHYRALDLETMSLCNVSNEMTLEKCEGMILVRDPDAAEETPCVDTEELTNAFAVTDVSENYLLIDRAALSYDGVQYGEVLPIARLFEDLLRADYRGRLYMKHTFVVSEPLSAKLLLEKERYLSLTVNGIPISPDVSDFDFNFLECDLSAYLHAGENEVIYSLDYYQHDGVHFALFDPLATESLRNCLYYDTNIENIYLCGDFTVDADRVLHPRRTLPPLSSRTHENGYPFFKGVLTLQGSYEYDGGKRCVLSLSKGRFLMAQVYVNGKEADLVLSTKKDITELLQIGKNDITVVLRSGLRNLFGPHHWRATPEPIHVSPRYFTFRCTWNGGEAPDYTPVYQSVPFGVDAIEMLRV